jgi:HEAT repeat protein
MRLPLSVLATCVLGTIPELAPAHGGTYRGPGAGLGPAGAPSSGTPNAGQPGPATGGAIPGLAGPATGSGADSGLDPVSWATWWAFNREPYLDLRGALERAAARASASSGASDLPLPRPADDAVVALALPALITAAREEKSPDVATAALLALGKCGPRLPRPEAERASDAIRSRLSDVNQEIAETATLALGILARPQDAALLGDLLADGEDARRAVQKLALPTRTRAFAAYALGILAARNSNPDLRRFAVHHLARAAAAAPGAQRDVPVAAVAALGLLPLPRAADVASGEGPAVPARALEAEIEFLLGLWREERRDPLVRAWAAVPLARIASAGSAADRARVLQELGAPLASGARDPAPVRQGAAIAVGILADGSRSPADERARSLLRQAGRDGDRLARRLCWMSLARASARPGPDGEHALAESRAWLSGELARGSTQERPWLALALALGEREAASRGIQPSHGVEDLLASSFVRHASPVEAGAHALALALARSPRAGELIARRISETSDEIVRADSALALGLVGEDWAIEPLRALVLESRYLPRLLNESAIALGLLGDRSLTELLVVLLREARGLTAQAAAANALGWVGNERALAPLIQMAADRGLDAGVRAFSLVAVGMLCDPAPLPWNTPYAVDAQWWLAPPTLHEPLTSTGVLDLF